MVLPVGSIARVSGGRNSNVVLVLRVSGFPKHGPGIVLGAGRIYSDHLLMRWDAYGRNPRIRLQT